MSSYFASYNKNTLIKFRLKRLFLLFLSVLIRRTSFPLQQHFDNFIDSITGT